MSPGTGLELNGGDVCFSLLFAALLSVYGKAVHSRKMKITGRRISRSGIPSAGRMRIGAVIDASNRVIWWKAWRRNRELATPRVDGLMVAYKEKARRYRTPVHRHIALAEIYYVDSGRVTVNCGGQTFPLGQRQFALFLPGNPHSMSGDPKYTPNVLVINFVSRDAFRLLPGLRLIDGKPVVPGETTLGRLDEICACARRDTGHDSRRAAALVELLLIDLAEEAGIVDGEGGRSSMTPADPLVRGFEQFVREHFRERLSLRRAAQAAGCSVSRLAHEYKRKTGRTPYDFILQCRMDDAKHLLRSTKKSIKEAAYASGFLSPAVFSRAFRRKEGISPVVYRRTLAGAR